MERTSREVLATHTEPTPGIGPSASGIGEGPLRIARVQEMTRALGPGARGVIWFQGCSLDCRGCIAASMNAAPPLFRIDADGLAGWCLGLAGIEGITLSGGDPFDQPTDALADFLDRVRSRSALSVMVYTGRTIDQLRRSGDPHVHRCLASIDILVDGPYVEALNDGAGWRGSSNQVIHRIGPRSGGIEEASTLPRRLELALSPDGTVSLTGMPPRGVGLALTHRLGFMSEPASRGSSRGSST